MNKINNKTIKDYLIGKATAKEMEQLAQWLADSEENQKELFEMELAFHLGKNSSVASPQKVEEAENRLFAQIDKHEEHTIKNNRLHFFRYAAAMIVAVLLDWRRTFCLSPSVHRNNHCRCFERGEESCLT